MLCGHIGSAALVSVRGAAVVQICPLSTFLYARSVHAREVWCSRVILTTKLVFTQRLVTIMADGHGASGPRTGNGHPQKSQSEGKNPLAFHLGGLQNLLKLRTTYRFNERLSGLIGADLNVQQQTAFPVATLQYEVCLASASITDEALSLRAAPSFDYSMQVIAKGRHWGALQATTKGLAIQKSFTLQKKDLSCKITPKVGYTFQGMGGSPSCAEDGLSASSIGLKSCAFKSAALLTFAQV